jgi:hypothetical protein
MRSGVAEQDRPTILGFCSYRTGFSMLEMTDPPASTSTRTIDPAANGPTPSGVPVAITSPGSSVMIPLM